MKIKRSQQQVAQNIQRYLDALETADRMQGDRLQAKTEQLQDKINKRRQCMRQLDEIKRQLKSEPGEQLSLTDVAVEQDGAGLHPLQ